ncbi:MAG: c-type cytochrome [Burkholderiales bacterium]
MLIAFFTPYAAAQTAAKPKPVPIAERLQACAGCHGADGNSVTPGIPSLAAQPKVYIENVLVLTREGMRGNAVMQGLMRGISDREIVALATHFAALPAKPVPGAPDKALLAKGRTAADKLHCGSCHLPNYRGREQMPRLAGQREEVLYTKLIAFRDKAPPGTDTIMSATLYGVTDADIKAMAHFLAQAR